MKLLNYLGYLVYLILKMGTIIFDGENEITRIRLDRAFFHFTFWRPHFEIK